MCILALLLATIHQGDSNPYLIMMLFCTSWIFLGCRSGDREHQRRNVVFSFQSTKFAKIQCKSLTAEAFLGIRSDGAAQSDLLVPLSTSTFVCLKLQLQHLLLCSGDCVCDSCETSKYSCPSVGFHHALLSATQAWLCVPVKLVAWECSFWLSF